jgi:hypothetical protein
MDPGLLTPTDFVFILIAIASGVFLTDISLLIEEAKEKKGKK